MTMNRLTYKNILLGPVSRENVIEGHPVANSSGQVNPHFNSPVKYILHDEMCRKPASASHRLLQLLLGAMVGTFLFMTLVFPLIRWRCPTAPSMDSSKDYESLLAFKIAQRSCRQKKENDLLFIGVMTSKDFINTRAKALFQTWGQSVPGRLIFFSSGDQPSRPKIPVVNLPGVNDVYPPQKKSFMMLKFMYDNLLDDYEWFIRADDDVFFKVSAL